MRVAHICENWGKGGIQYLIRDLCDTFDSRGVSSLVMFLYEDGRVGPETGDSWSVHSIGMNQSVRIDPLGLLRLRRELSRFSPDMVHCHSYYTALAGLMIRKSGLDIPIVYTVHADLIPERQRSNALIRKVARCCDAVVAVSAHTAATVASFTHGVVKPLIVCDGIDFQRMLSAVCARDESRRRLNLGPDSFVVLSIARLTIQKDHPTLFKALAVAMRQLPNVRLLVVGTGPERQRLEKMAQDLGLEEHLVFCGEVAWPDLGVFLAAADVSVLSTRNEGFGICVVEAASAGLPIIATARGPIVDLERAGLGIALVQPGNVQSLAEAISMMSDPAIREKYARGNSQKARALFSIERTADEYMDIYLRLSLPQSQARILQAFSS